MRLYRMLPEEFRLSERHVSAEGVFDIVFDRT